MTGKPAAAQHLRDLARLRRVRDRIDREYAQPLDVEALARDCAIRDPSGNLIRIQELALSRRGDRRTRAPSARTERPPR